MTYVVTVRLPAGIGKRVDKVLKGGELRSAFIRAAVEAELQHRELTKELAGDNSDDED